MKKCSISAAFRWASVVFFAYGANAVAQGLTAQTPAEIESVTVVGQATNSLITTEDLETYQANDLADVFRLVPSISVGGSLGIAQKIYIRGLEDSLLNVTVDGAPQTSTLFHHIGRVTIDPDLLEEVEVQAGAGEATSGAGAIGGAIRFKTKGAEDLLSDDRSFGGKLKVNQFTNDGSQNSATLYGRIADGWGVLGYYNQTERENMEDGDGNEILGTAADQTLTFLKVDGQIRENQTLALSYEAREEEGEFSRWPNWAVGEDYVLYGSEGERETVVLNYGLQTGDLLNVEATVYQTKTSFQGGRFDWLTEIESTGFDFRNTSTVGNSQFIYGVDYRADEVISGGDLFDVELSADLVADGDLVTYNGQDLVAYEFRGAIYVDLPTDDPLAVDYAQEGSVLGAYFQGHTQLTDAFLLSYGVRYDRYEFETLLGNPIASAFPELAAINLETLNSIYPAKIDSTDLSFNTGLEYKLTNELTFGLGFAQAARGKEISDGFTQDGIDYSASANVDPDLQSENVTNIEGSLEYELDGFNAKFAVYRSEIDDVIFDQLYGGTFYENAGSIETTGIEFDLEYQLNNLMLYAGFSSGDSEFDPKDGLYIQEYSAIALNGYEFNGLGDSIGNTWILGLSYAPASDWMFGFNVSHVSSLTLDSLHQDLDAETDVELYSLSKPSYTVADAFIEWTPANLDWLRMNLAVTNLFNETYRDHASVGDFTDVPGYEVVAGPLEPGRDIRLSASFSF